MLREALEFIFKKADESTNPIPHIRNLGPRRRVITLSGLETEEIIDPATIVRSAHSLAAVATLTEKFMGPQPTVFVNEKGVTVVLDDDDRVERVFMKFVFSKQYEALLSLGNGASQRDLVRILRTKLAGCVKHESIVPIVRQIEFGVNRNSSANIKHTSESMGRSVEKEVRTKAGELPEDLMVIVPLFSVPCDAPSEIRLQCAVEVDMDNEKISLVPTGDSLAREIDRVINDILVRLDQFMPEGVIVVAGDCN